MTNARDQSFKGIEPLPSTDKKKQVAIFENDKTGRTRRTKFGARGYEDYTTHKDRSRKASQRDRHRRDLRTGDPQRAGFLSWFILWNKPTLQGSINDYERRQNIWKRTGTFPIE